ncbi:MAG: AAA family ATPase [Methylobacteriaceae bacterium]|nr:AAA family ATPase [Methylobacteriaceae bacterium]MBV9245893.1 AAA family ATPase [Methylobacteriaceae bacterium]
MDIAVWLRSLDLEQYEAAFRENAIDAEILPKLSAEDLKDIGVTAVGHRRKLLEAIAGLTSKPAAEAMPRAAERADAGERRQVTILFADLAGYTQLSTELDAEELHALRSAFTETTDAVVVAHGGTIERHIGDCVMAVFGAPVAHGNDPERAVYAGLAVRDAMPGLTDRFGRSIEVHVGVASGEVVASGIASPDQIFTVTGESVNLASRLTSQARTGEILISAAVHRALADRLECVSIGALPVKGFEEPIHAWRVIGRRRSAVAEERPFVGRQSEMRQLAAAISACLETGRGQTLYIRGEAGIGKTRLVEEFRRAAASSGFACHSGLVLDFGTDTGRDAVRSIVRSLAGVPPGADAELVRAKAQAVFAAERAEPHRIVFLYDLLDLAQPVELRAHYDAMDNATRSRGARETAAQMVAMASRANPVLLVIEDVHWADRGTLESISALAETVTEHRALMVLTSRLEGDPLARGWRVGGALLTVDLAPLRRDEALALAARFLDTATAFAARCIERAAGNPLFLEQLVRHAEERAEGGVPDSVQSLVQARMDRLGLADKQALQAASVFGQRFSLEGVRYLLGDPNYEARGLEANYLVHWQDEGFLFAHALIRDAVYATLLHSRRRELHRLAAAWFAERDPSLNAEHLDRAEDARASGAYLAAARGQAAQYRYERALALIERGISLADASQRSVLTACRGEILHHLGLTAEAQAAYEAALAAAQDDAERCRAWLGLAAVKRITDDLDGALADLQLAKAAATRLQLTAEAALAHFLHGNVLFPRGDIEGCLREHEQALALARQAGAAEIEAEALGGLGDAEFMRGRMLTALDRFRRCVEVAKRGGFGRVEVANRGLVALMRWYAGDTKGGLDEALASIEAAARVGHHRAETVAHMSAYTCRYSLTDLAGAAMHVESALALSRQLGTKRFEGQSLIFRAELHRLAGRRAAAFEDMNQAFAIIAERGLAFMKPPLLAMVAVASNDRATREKCLAEGEALLATNSMGHNDNLFRMEAMEACLGGEDWDGAERHAMVMEEFSRHEPSPLTRFFVARGRALAGHGRGRRDAALNAQLEGLIADGERFGYRMALPAMQKALDGVPAE